jgi:hypothetical protein
MREMWVIAVLAACGSSSSSPKPDADGSAVVPCVSTILPAQGRQCEAICNTRDALPGEGTGRCFIAVGSAMESCSPMFQSGGQELCCYYDGGSGVVMPYACTP